MGSTGKVKSDYEKFTSISRATKGIAAELKVPLLLISQTSRANSMDRRAELEVSDLRGSGAIEEDAAVVMLLYYDSEDFKMAKNDPERLKRGPIKTWLKLGKNRYGPQGTYELLNHHKAQTRFDPAEVSQ
jgi:replicative DNA helicase